MRGATMESIKKINPVTGEEIGTFPAASREEVQAAVSRARRAFPAWRDTPLDERLSMLSRLKEVLRDRTEEFARRISKDTGKPLVDSLTTDLLSLPLFLDYYRKEAPRILGRRKVKTPLLFFPRKSYLEHMPMGVIAVISPWNFPFQLSVVPAISALIAGNTVVLKPSSTTPITGEVIREMFSDAGLADGVLEVIQGGGAIGAALIEAEVDKIFFTGSVETGRRVMAAAARRPIPVELELGGKDAMIVLEDANLERAARAAVWGGLLNCGQMCTAVERVLVVRPVYRRFIDLVREKMTKIRTGGPGEDAEMGPLTTHDQREVVRKQVDEAVREGAEVILGGEQPEGPGFFYPPTLITGVTPKMSVYREETFGPVLPVIPVADADEAVCLANRHQYGLTASVWTRDVKKGMELASRLEAGQVNVNDVAVSVMNPALPFGGVKSSGFGRYHGPEGLLSFTHPKAIMVSRGLLDSEPFWFPYAGKFPVMLKAFQSFLEKKPGRLLGAIVTLFRARREDR